MTAQQLKNSILQMAVQGKLVPQDPNDEPASVLLERIRAEKQKLIKEGKIKPEKNPSVIFRGEDNLPYEKIGKNEPVCIADELPFEIPESWVWVRLKNIVNVVSARRVHQSDWKTSGVPFYRVREIGALSEYDQVKNELFISEELYAEFSKSGVPQKDDLMITAVGTLGKVYIVKETDRFYYKDASVICLENFGKIQPEYLKTVIHSPYLMALIKKKSAGTTVDTITIANANEYLIPVPPLNEQTRIVSKLHECIPALENYNKKESYLSNMNTAFPELLKKSILQQAVMGKLVPQDDNDEPASVLLEKIYAEKEALIKAGKLRKDKHESIIYRRDNSHYEKIDGVENCIDDEIPFEIPDTWAWARASSLGSMIRGKGIKRTETVSNGIPCVRYGEIYTSYSVSFSDTISFIDESLDNSCLHFSSGDIVFTLTGENKVDIAKGVAYLGKGRVAAGGDLAYWTAHGMNPIYLVYYMASPYCIERKRRTATGDIIVHISTDKVGAFLVPIPPLAEQERIVEAITAAFAMLSAL